MLMLFCQCCDVKHPFLALPRHIPIKPKGRLGYGSPGLIDPLEAFDEAASRNGVSGINDTAHEYRRH